MILGASAEHVASRRTAIAFRMTTELRKVTLTPTDSVSVRCGEPATSGRGEALPAVAGEPPRKSFTLRGGSPAPRRNAHASAAAG